MQFREPKLLGRVGDTELEKWLWLRVTEPSIQILHSEYMPLISKK